MASSEFRRQQSRVWWANVHGDDLAAALGSPIPRSPAAPATPATPATPAVQGASPAGNPNASGTPGQAQGGEPGSRDASCSPSSSHKSQDSGFSDSDGSHRAHASPLSSSPEVTDGAQLPGTPSPTHSRLQLCLSGACTSTPRHAAQGPGPASFGGHATPGELRGPAAKDDSAIQSRPLPAIPCRRQHSTDEAAGRRRSRTCRAQLSRSAAAACSLDSSLDDGEPAASLNQTFPLTGPPGLGHRAPRSFIKNKAAARPPQQRYSRTFEPQSPADDSAASEAPTPHHTTVLHVRRSTPDGRAASEAFEAVDASLAVGGLVPDDAQRHLLDVTAGPGLPAHTSTPKAVADAPPPASTPTRRPAAGGGRPLHDRRASARPVNLLSNFNKDEESVVAEVAVAAWLGGLRLCCEPEPSITLQSKALLGADPEGLRQLRGVQLASPQGLSQLQRRAQLLSTEYTRLCGRVQRGALDQLDSLTQTFVGHVLDFLEEHALAVPRDRASALRDACETLRADAFKALPEPADLAASLASVRAALTSAVDAVLEKQVQELVAVLEGPASPLSLRTAVSALCALGRQGSALAELVVRCGGVRALLQVVLDARTSATRRAALRALSAVCCTAKAVRSLERAGGVEVIAELLSEVQRPEDERAEAAAVLAQITAPWVPDNARVEGLSQHLDAVVHALTHLVRGASSAEVLLLSAAALSHLSYVEPSAVWPLLTSGAAGAVLQAVRAQGARCSVFLQEQAATLLANMAAVPEARAELAAERAVVALLCFLQLRPSPLQRAADIAASERVQHKAAIALSRLASDPEVARQVVALEGVPRLVRLCRDQRERNHSDGVLVACLAALRKISANCGAVVLSKRDRRELLEPRLLDSFMLFSTRQESYV